MRRHLRWLASLVREKGHLLVLLLLFASSFWSVSRSFAPGYIAAWDNPSHLVKAEFFYQSLDLSRLGIWGWMPEWYDGCAPFIFYAPGFFILVSVIKVISLGALSLNDALKITLAFSYALFPIVLYWMCRALGTSRRIALASAVFSLTSSSVAGIGIDGVYGIGLYTHFLGIILFMIFIGLLHRAMQRGGAGREVILAGFAFGFLIITHSITTGYAGIASVLYLVFRLIYRRNTNIIAFAGIFLLGLLLSLFWLFPLLSSFRLFGPDAGFYPFSLEELIKRIVDMRLVVSQTTLLFTAIGILAGFYYIIRRRPNSMIWAYLITLTAITTVLASTMLVKLMEEYMIDDGFYRLVHRILMTMFQTRAAAFLGILLPVLAGLGFCAVIDLLSFIIIKAAAAVSRNRGARVMSFASGLLYSAAVLILLWAYSAEQMKMGRDSVKTIQTDYAEPYQRWSDVFFFLKNNASPGSLVKLDISFQEFPYPGFLGAGSMLVLETGLPTTDGNQIEMFQTTLCGYMNGLNFLDTMDDAAAKKLLHKTHVNYLLVAGKPEMEKDFLEKVYDDGKKIRVYKVTNLSGMDYYVQNITVLHDAYELTVSVESTESMNVSVPVQYNYHWDARVNGKPGKVVQGTEGFVTLELEPGLNHVELSFVRRPMDNLVFMLSLITFLIALILLLRPGKKAKA